jgi:protein-tyrosine phosphatase
MTITVLFVCMGNICRSPTAHGVFETLVARAGLQYAIAVESAGTGNWHVGEAPDIRARQAARQHGYDIDHLRARQVHASDFSRCDYVLAMDRDNLLQLEALKPSQFCGELRLFLDHASGIEDREVPDPYYGGDGGFDRVLAMVENAAAGLLRDIRQQHSC